MMLSLRQAPAVAGLVNNRPHGPADNAGRRPRWQAALAIAVVVVFSGQTPTAQTPTGQGPVVVCHSGGGCEVHCPPGGCSTATGPSNYSVL